MTHTFNFLTFQILISMARTKEQVLRERMGKNGGGDATDSSDANEEIALKNRGTTEMASPSGSKERKRGREERRKDDGTPDASSSLEHSSSSSEEEVTKKRPKKKNKKKTVTKVIRKQPSDEELRKRYLKKKQYDAENAAR